MTIQVQNQFFHYLIDPSFQRLFVCFNSKMAMIEYYTVDVLFQTLK